MPTYTPHHHHHQSHSRGPSLNSHFNLSLVSPPKQISLLGCENWASNLQRGQEMTQHPTTLSQGGLGNVGKIDPADGGVDNAYHSTAIWRKKVAGSRVAGRFWESSQLELCPSVYSHLLPTRWLTAALPLLKESLRTIKQDWLVPS